MAEARPQLSVVIPTRDRSRTLAFALQTCVAQEFADCEFVVSDNSEDPAAARAIVERFDDPRLKYVRPPERLAMTDSWEFALGRASGEYVTVLGDDDGLLLHALPEIDRPLRMLGAPLLHWESVCYNWPDIAVQSTAHELLVPRGQADHYHPIRRTEARPLIVAAADSRVSYARLPMIFGTAVHRTLVDRLRAATGRVFRSQSPDVYSAFAFGHLAETYHSVAAPMTISGLSGRSNGVAAIQLRGKSDVHAEFRRLNAAAGHRCHPRVPDLPVMAALVADGFEHAKDALFPDDRGLSLDRRALVGRCLEALAAVDEEEWREVVAAARQALGDDADLRAWFEAEWGDRRPGPAPRPTPLPRYGGTYLHLDADEFGVSDVVGVARLCEKLLGYKRDGVNAHLVAGPRPEPGSRLVRGWRRLRADARRIAGRAGVVPR